MPLTRGVHHVGLTVSDVDRAAAFFVEELGFHIAGGRLSYPSVFVSDGTNLLTLWQATPDPRPFDRKGAIGLHHLALRLAEESDLDRLNERLDTHPDCEVEFCPEPLGTTGARHMMFRGPSGIRLELIWVPE